MLPVGSPEDMIFVVCSLTEILQMATEYWSVSCWSHLAESPSFLLLEFRMLIIQIYG